MVGFSLRRTPPARELMQNVLKHSGMGAQLRLY